MAGSSQHIRAALGANVPIPVCAQAHGPFGLLQLQAELVKRLRASAGSSDPEPQPHPTSTRRDAQIRRLFGLARDRRHPPPVTNRSVSCFFQVS
jgi:hypothetical protein